MARKRPRTEVAAAIDIGSYSVHLLVAGVGGHALETLHDESAFLGLGQAIGETGDLAEARSGLVETISGYVMRAWALGATTITIVGTDPLRRASDAAAAIAEISAATGIEVLVLSHDEEALVALVGVQAGRPVLRETAVIDVGGGSTEVLAVGAGPGAGSGRAAARRGAPQRRPRPSRSADAGRGGGASRPLAARDDRRALVLARRADRRRRDGPKPPAGRAAAGEPDAHPPPGPTVARPADGGTRGSQRRAL